MKRLLPRLRGRPIYTVNVNCTQDPKASPDALATTVVKAVESYERRNGPGWRAS